MSTVDLVLLVILGVSIILGLWRGFVFEVLSLLGWVVAYFAAQWAVPFLGPHLPVGAPGSAVNAATAFVIAFVLVLIIWGLLARLVKLLIEATPLSFIDRGMGAVFGLLRGLVLLLAAATLILITPIAHSAAWQESRGAAWLTALLQDVKPLLPASLAAHLPT
jgi:membrane protein required for colicin V production